MNKYIEYCPHCDRERAVNLKSNEYVCVCTCGKKLFACNKCFDDQRDKGIADANIVCDWNQDTGTCFRCKGK